MSILLRPDGSVAADRMRTETLATLKRVVSDDRLKRDLGLERAAAGPHPAASLLAGSVLQTLSLVDALILARVGATPEIIRELAPYTPEQEAAIGPPLERILSKYLASHLERWGDEVALALALITVTTAKVSAAKARIGQPISRVIPFPAAPEPSPAPPESPADVAMPVPDATAES